MTSTEISLRKDLPTMYDLPSECVGDPGLPDEFHDLQPQLLSRSLTLADYTRDEWFTGSDLHLYYDANHPLWYKRPDWFLAVGVSRLYEGKSGRYSYVIWQEKQPPCLVVEFLSPGTEAEDLGRFYARPSVTNPIATERERPPGKFAVYEERLRVCHYVTYNHLERHLRYFQLVGDRYREREVGDCNPKVWFSDLEVGLGVWEGTFEGLPDRWLRWCDGSGNWLPTDTEQERQQRDRAEAERDRERAEKEALLEKLRAAGIDPDEL